MYYSIFDVFIPIFSVLVIIFVRLIILDNAKAIYNIYQRPSNFYWVKVLLMYVVLKLKQIKQLNNEKNKTSTERFTTYSQLECAKPLPDTEKAVDAVYFNAADSNGNHLLFSTATRKHKLVDGFVYLKLKDTGLGLLESPKLPGTSLYQTDYEEGKYEVEGIKMSVVEPMKKWRISYEGKMKRFENREEQVDVKINAIWTSYLPHLNFDLHMDPWLMAKVMACETWTREYFETLQSIHQTHYEQHGDISGSVEINGKSHAFNMTAMRDHSLGLKREWRYFHRYGLHFLATENGDRMTIGAISIPIAFSNLKMGYIYVAKDKKMYPITDLDFELSQHGENGQPPLDYAFTFYANEKQYTVQVNVVDSPVFYLSKDWESKIIERLCKFEVNGVAGWGAAEFQYRNINGKNVDDYKEVAHISK